MKDFEDFIGYCVCKIEKTTTQLAQIDFKLKKAEDELLKMEKIDDKKIDELSSELRKLERLLYECTNRVEQSYLKLDDLSWEMNEEECQKYESSVGE